MFAVCSKPLKAGAVLAVLAPPHFHPMLTRSAALRAAARGRSAFAERALTVSPRTAPRATPDAGNHAQGKEITMLRIVDVILELIRDVAPLVDQIGRHDAALAKQLRDALNSAALNTAEGGDQRGARRTNHYAIALGSARESLVALRAAQAWRYISPLPDSIVARFDHVLGTLVNNVRRR
jgi:four helix bundle protein